MPTMNASKQLKQTKENKKEMTWNAEEKLEFCNWRKQNVLKFKNPTSIFPKNNPHSKFSLIFSSITFTFCDFIEFIIIYLSISSDAASSASTPCSLASNFDKRTYPH